MSGDTFDDQFYGAMADRGALPGSALAMQPPKSFLHVHEGFLTCYRRRINMTRRAPSGLRDRNVQMNEAVSRPVSQAMAG
jgi:hypothetical protein